KRTGILRVRRATEERADLHLEDVAGALTHEAAEQERTDVALHDGPAAERHFRCGEGPPQKSLRVAECLAVERSIFAERKGYGDGLSTPPSAANALTIVCDRRWNIGHHHGRDGADVDAHFHGCRTTKDVDLAGLEFPLVAAQP